MVFILSAGKKHNRYIMFDINCKKKNKQTNRNETNCYQYFYGLNGFSFAL